MPLRGRRKTFEDDDEIEDRPVASSSLSHAVVELESDSDDDAPEAVTTSRRREEDDEDTRRLAEYVLDAVGREAS